MELSYFVLLLIDESAVCVPVSVQRFSVLTDNKCQCFKMAAQKTRLLIHTFIFLIVTSTFNTDDLNSAVSASEWHTARTWWTRSPSEVLIRGIVVLISWSIVLHWWLCVCVCGCCCCCDWSCGGSSTPPTLWRHYRKWRTHRLLIKTKTSECSRLAELLEDDSGEQDDTRPSLEPRGAVESAESSRYFVLAL